MSSRLTAPTASSRRRRRRGGGTPLPPPVPPAATTTATTTAKTTTATTTADPEPRPPALPPAEVIKKELVTIVVARGASLGTSILASAESKTVLLELLSAALPDEALPKNFPYALPASAGGGNSVVRVGDVVVAKKGLPLARPEDWSCEDDSNNSGGGGSSRGNGGSRSGTGSGGSGGDGDDGGEVDEARGGFEQSALWAYQKAVVTRTNGTASDAPPMKYHRGGSHCYLKRLVDGATFGDADGGDHLQRNSSKLSSSSASSSPFPLLPPSPSSLRALGRFDAQDLAATEGETNPMGFTLLHLAIALGCSTR